jgi:fatty acid hydroxylase family protein
MTAEERERLRREALEKPGWYSPWAHVFLPAAVGLTVAIAALSQVRGPTPGQIAFGVFIFLLSNATEWRIHSDILHKRVRPFDELYDRHTPEHHMIFVSDDMSIRSPREFRLVLIPVVGVLGIFLLTVPPALALLWLGLRNAAAIYLAVTVLYVVSYEWMHLAWHLPPESFIGRLWLVRVLRQHHATHHDPRLMQRWNFNVTLPLWDFVRRTRLSPRSAASMRAAS